MVLSASNLKRWWSFHDIFHCASYCRTEDKLQPWTQSSDQQQNQQTQTEKESSQSTSNVQKQEENRSYQSSSCLHKRDKIKWEPLPTNHWKENSFRTIKSEFIAEVSEDKDFANLLAQCRCTRFQPLTRAAKPAWLNSQQSPLAAKGSEPKAQTYQYCNKDKNTVNKSFCKEWKQK